jgi:hypothetical protein
MECDNCKNRFTETHEKELENIDEHTSVTKKLLFMFSTIDSLI